MKIIIVDDEPLARSRLLAMITELGAGEVVGEADNGTDALRLVEQVVDTTLKSHERHYKSSVDISTCRLES